MPWTYEKWFEYGPVGDTRYIVARQRNGQTQYFTANQDWSELLSEADTYATLDWARTVAQRLGGYLQRLRKDPGGVTVI